MEDKTILQVKNLSVHVNGEHILNDISFDLKRGEALAVIGPNGAGKTTLFRALLGLAPYKGEIIWNDGGNIGYVPQKFYFERSIPITAREFFLLKSPRFWFPSREFFAHLEHELALAGLKKPILTKPIGELSGGQFQRLLIAWAMLNHPDVLLFDEPTANVDVGFEETVYTIMHRLQEERGTTVLLISHDLDIVYRYASKVLCVNKEMVCYGRPVDVLTSKELSKLYGDIGYYHHK